MFDIIVPTYRINPEWLDRCLQSIQEQTVDEWECYVIDGTPEDWTDYDLMMSVVSRYVSDERFTYVRQAGGGVSQARNQGIEIGCSPWIAFLDGDDYWYPEHLIEFTKNLHSFDEMAKYWLPSQEKLNLNQKTNFLKTHHLLAAWKNNNFTNSKNTLGAIYIVRDPRNVITSLKNHYDLDYEQSLDFMLNEKKYIYDIREKNDYSDFHFLSSWSNHYKSWTNNNLFKRVQIVSIKTIYRTRLAILTDISITFWICS